MKNIEYSEAVSLKCNIKALFTWVNFSVREMTEGRVQISQEQIAESKETEASMLEALLDQSIVISELELNI